MLKRNIDISKGLCNCRLGVIKKINYFDNRTASSLDIVFDGYENVTNITKVTSNYELQRNVFVTRSQFLISIAWAITIHKSQGLSLDGVLVDLGADVFESGMAYVALSRARSLKNVHIIDLNVVFVKNRI